MTRWFIGVIEWRTKTRHLCDVQKITDSATVRSGEDQNRNEALIFRELVWVAIDTLAIDNFYSSVIYSFSFFSLLFQL